MPKILLIQPSADLNKPELKTENAFTKTVPLNMISLAAFLRKQGYSVKILDCRVCKKNLWKIIDKELVNADCVGISAMTVHIKHGLQICKYIKKNKNIPIIWGGIHATLFPKETCENPYIDYVVRGEGEYTLLELLNHIIKKNSSLDKIQGLVYKLGGQVRINEKRKLIDLNGLPMPAYDLLDIEKYVVRIIKNKRVRMLDIATSRGCPFRCAFCTNSILEAQKWRAMPAEKVVDIIDHLVRKYKLEGIHIIEDFFFGDKRRVEKIANGIIKRKLKIFWGANIRADCFKKNFIDNSFLKLLKKSGCQILSIGVESGSDSVLKILKKDITVKQTISAVKQCHKYKITPFCFFMIGIPGEAKRDMEKTFSLLNQLRKICPDIQIYGPGLFRLYPGSELYNSCKKKKGFYEPNTLEEWAKCNLDENYLSIKNLSWIKEKKFIKNRHLYFYWADCIKNPYFTPTFFTKILGKMAKFRFNHNFWSFQFEPLIVPHLSKIKNFITKQVLAITLRFSKTSHN